MNSQDNQIPKTTSLYYQQISLLKYAHNPLPDFQLLLLSTPLYQAHFKNLVKK